MAGALINVERFYEVIVPLYPALESLSDEQLDRTPTWASTPERSNRIVRMDYSWSTPDSMRTLTSAEPPRVSGFPMSSRPRCTSVASALRSELGCERAGQSAGTVFVSRSGSLEVCRL
jgi:hypothetical protein